ncbi:MAG: hypothetical protein J7M03_02010, partial [Candidatus Desulfofervidaceae bacterium]|nr:hypothetical protein [Candidatus Desulfofervidaceae bacterium]
MGLLEGYLSGISPAYAKRMQQEKAAEAQRLARTQDNRMLNNLLGNEELPEENLAQDAFDMEEAQVMGLLGEGEGVYKPHVE